MDRQLVIRHRGPHFHVVFHDYMGEYEGHIIGKKLGLEEIPCPPDEVGPAALQPGQYYMWHAYDRHPDLHALMPADQLGRLSEAVEEFHVRVVEGAEALPELPEDRKPHYNTESYIERIEHEHMSAFERGPRAVIGAFVFRAIPALVVLLAVLVGSRHMSDSREPVSLGVLQERLAQPLVQQSSVARFWNPDRSNYLSTKVQSVRYYDGDRFMLSNGQLLELRGGEGIEPVLDAAQEIGTVPWIDVDREDGRARVAQVRVGDREFCRGCELVFLEKFKPSAEKPGRRFGEPKGNEFQVLPGLPPDPSALLGRRLALQQLRVTADGEGGWFFASDGDQAVRLVLARRSPVAEELLAFAEANGEEVVADMVLDTAGGPGGVVASGELYSLSMQGYHVVARP